MRRFIGILVFILSTSGITWSQGQLSLYQMQNSVPQATFVNPAFSPKSKIIIGLPVISSTYISLQTPFSIGDVLAPGTSDSLRIDTDAILEALKSNNRISIDGSTNLLFFGLNGKNGFLTVSLNSRLNGSFAFPGGAFELIVSGPEATTNGQRSIELEEFDLKTTVFNELAFSYNRKINDELTVGGKLKYLQGIVNMNLAGLSGKILTSIDSIYISVSPWSLQTAGLDYLADNPEAGYFLFQNKNVGWAFDLGAQYMVNDNLKISASILDIGSIKWKEQTKTHEFDSINYKFEGFDFLEIIKEDGNIDQSILDKELDSLNNKFDPSATEGDPYSTPLTGRFYLGGTYTLMDMHTVGAIFYGEVFKSRLTPALALTYNLNIGRLLDVGISASYRNKTFGNFGGGISLKGGPIQFYVLGENIESMFYPARARVVGVRGGLLLSLGKSADSRFE